MDQSAARKILDTVLSTFDRQILDVNGALLLATRQLGNRSKDNVHADPIALEATWNKRYVTDLIGLAATDEPENREWLMSCGRVIMRVWAERIALQFPER